jgi:hypothetical protein
VRPWSTTGSLQPFREDVRSEMLDARLRDREVEPRRGDDDEIRPSAAGQARAIKWTVQPGPCSVTVPEQTPDEVRSTAQAEPPWCRSARSGLPSGVFRMLQTPRVGGLAAVCPSAGHIGRCY